MLPFLLQMVNLNPVEFVKSIAYSFGMSNDRQVRKFISLSAPAKQICSHPAAQ